jgi:hypothetical protein
MHYSYDACFLRLPVEQGVAGICISIVAFVHWMWIH